ncbi:hypothetical protein SAY87_031349 [Trapa incisa]|uniref:Uncharacterized protein n=1 Tax=Trapa incisa TaxID=236973 RepID=A0AAN7KPK4_9MYRT|nr:hypothetical protein SAY87_031349 [Trapa incisa]
MEHAEKIVSLLDFFWFEQEVFGKRVPTVTPVPVPIPCGDQNQETAERSSSGSKQAEISRVPSNLLRSVSDQLSSQTSFLFESTSPNSVLRFPDQLRTVLSGKEVSEEVLLSVSGIENQGAGRNGNLQQNRGNEERMRRRKKNKKVLSKSLSDLEFEELKGFMDLGFIFSEEDKNSSLAYIIPGLQRFGKKEREQHGEVTNLPETDHKFEEAAPNVSSSTIPRPYLSETWEWLERRRTKADTPLVNWNFPSLTNETGMKDNLIWWAHTVASTVR